MTQLLNAPYGEHFGVYPVQPFLFCLTGVKNEDIGLKNTYFGTLIQNNQADSSARPRFNFRYLNFRWQTIRAFSEKRELIARVADLLLRKDEADPAKR